MLLHKAVIQALTVAIGEHDSRYGLAGIHIDPDGVAVATNGHVMLYARTPATIPADEYPSTPTPNTAAIDAGASVAGQTVPIAALTQAVKHVRAKQRVSCYDHVAITPTDTGLRVVAVDRSMTVSDQHVAPVVGTFPAWERVLPKHTTTLTVRLGAEILANLAKAAKAVGGKDASVAFAFTDEGNSDGQEYTDAIGVKLSSTDGHDVAGVVMPMHKT